MGWILPSPFDTASATEVRAHPGWVNLRGQHQHPAQLPPRGWMSEQHGAEQPCSAGPGGEA